MSFSMIKRLSRRIKIPALTTFAGAVPVTHCPLPVVFFFYVTCFAFVAIFFALFCFFSNMSKTLQNNHTQRRA